jgi:branched-chain amino acid transport system ATP-binding protein
MIEAFRELKDGATSLLVVEQNFVFARQLGDTVAIMDDGKVAHTGGMAAFAADSGLQQHLLGLGMGEHQ